MPDDKISIDNLSDVPITMLVPLYARAIETKRKGIIRDEQAVALLDQIDFDFSQFDANEGTFLGIIIRTEILDEQVSTFIQAHPNATIVNLGAGLDTRFQRVDNGYITWYDLDLPESIAIRKRLLPESERNHFISRSVLDFTWIDEIQGADPILLIAEGLLMYFDESDVHTLLTTLAKRLPGAEMLLEVLGVTMAKRTDRHASVAGVGAAFKWGIRHAHTLADWHDAITYLGDISTYDRHEDRWLALDIDWPAPLADLRNTTNRIVHLRFGF